VKNRLSQPGWYDIYPRPPCLLYTRERQSPSKRQEASTLQCYPVIESESSRPVPMVASGRCLWHNDELWKWHILWHTCHRRAKIQGFECRCSFVCWKSLVGRSQDLTITIARLHAQSFIEGLHQQDATDRSLGTTPPIVGRTWQREVSFSWLVVADHLFQWGHASV